MISRLPKASIIIPVRNANKTLGMAIKSIFKCDAHELAEIIVVNDGLDDKINLLAKQYPVKVISGNGKGAAAARNIGVQCSKGKVLIFVDADCIVSPEWFLIHLMAHERSEDLLVVGGSICIKNNASFWERCDHYSSWYNAHPYQKEQYLPNHPAANLSMSRSTFNKVGPFNVELPTHGVHEEIEWQDQLHRLGGRILFKPSALVWHVDRSNFKTYMEHNFKWGYNSIQVKGRSNISRFPLVFKRPLLLIIGFIPFSFAHTVYTIICWLRAGKLEPLFLGIFLSIGKLAYAYGMAVGGFKYLQLNEKNMRE
jgi:glycosyltransferase involved in cell wall biosynthesis